MNGPVIPNQIKKALGGDITLISAILSELKSAGKVQVSDTKVGGSPTYYVKGQEAKLQSLGRYLNEKDRKAFELLRDKKILRDYDLSTLLRVNMRKIKDFAVPLTVKVKDEKEIFWKWYLMDNQDAENIILEMIGVKKKIEKKIKEPRKEEKPISKPKKEIKLKRVDDTKTKKDNFFNQIIEFFQQKGIRVVDEKIIRKNSDIEFVVKMPTAVGTVEYFCKAKNKKKCSDGDLSSAYLTGQARKLPVLFITTGEIAKKSRQKLNTEYKGMVVKEI
jgi:hypothetical protein